MANATRAKPSSGRAAVEVALRGVGLDGFAALEGPLRVVRLRRGETLLQAGDEPDAVYALLEGDLVVHPGSDNGHEPAPVALAPGAIIGETALVVGGRRSGTVVAGRASKLVRIEGDHFTALLEQDNVLAEAVADEALQRLRRIELSRHVTRLLGKLTPEGLAALEGRCTFTHLPAGETLFAEGDPGDAAYLVLSGRVAARSRGRLLGEAGAGELIGEAALLEGGSRTATVVAVRDSEFARLDRSTLEMLVIEHPSAGLAFLRRVVQRTVHGQGRPERAATLSIAIVPTSADVDVRALSSALTEQLGGRGPVAHLWSARIDAQLGKDGVAQRPVDDPAGLRLTTWLHEVERRSRYVVYELDRTPSGWSRRALRWADLVLFVGDGAGEPSRTALTDAVWAWLGDHPPRTALALFHGPSTARPRRTAAWLATHPVDDCHHLRRDAPGDLARLARLLSGTAVGVALSGGGARGFAHLGVLRALGEAGVPVDVAGGTSMGAVIASGCAMGLTAEEMTAVCVRGFRNVLDYTVPLVSMVKGGRIVRGMRATYGDRDVEDLWRTFFCVSANLTRSETVIHRRGPLVDAVRASVAIPGVIPPVPYHGDLLVDGGVLNNLPLDELHATGLIGTAIAVDVTPTQGPRAKGDFGLSVSALEVVGSKLRRRRHPAPGITRVLLRSMLLGAMRDRDRQVAQGGADLFLDLDLRGIDMLDFDAVERVAAAGYEAAAPRVQAWLSGSAG